MSRHPDGVETLDPGPAEEAQCRVAGALERLGIGRGDRVMFCLESSASLLVCVLGAARRGVVPVLLNATLLAAERAALIADAEPALVVSDPSGLTALLSGPGADLAPYPLVRPMHYTSGTTGRPKGVWSGVLDDSEARALFDDEADLWGFGPSDTHFVCSPMYHSVSVRLAGAALLRGGRGHGAAPVRRLGGCRRARASRAHDHVHGAHGVAARHGCVPRREVLRLPTPPRPRRRAVPRSFEAGRAGAGASRGAVGVLRIDRGPVHGVLAAGVGAASGDRGPGPPWQKARHRRRRRGVVSRTGLRRASSTGATRPPPSGLGGATLSPSATWAPWTRTAISFSTAVATTSSSAAGSMCTPWRSRPCWRRCRESSRWPSSASLTRTGASACVPPWWESGRRGTAPTCGGAPGAVQASQAVFPRERAPPHAHGEAASARSPRRPGAGPGPSRYPGLTRRHAPRSRPGSLGSPATAVCRARPGWA